MYQLDDISLNPEEENEVSKAVFEQVLEQSDLAEHHDIVTGIQHDTQIPFVGTLGLVGKKILKCKPDANGNQIPLSEKFWKPVLIGDRFEHCAVELNPLFKLFKKAMKINPDFYNRIGSEELGVVGMRIEEAMREMLQRIAWFGDTAADTFANGGNLTNGTDAGFFNMLDGIWKQILAVDIPSGSRYHVEIEANTEATKEEQLAWLTDEDDMAFKLFKQMWRNADPRLKQLVGKGLKLDLHVTSGLAENWMEFKENKSLAFTLGNVEDGGLKNFFRNINIVTRYDWDDVIQNYQDNGTKFNLPHRALLTTAGNIPIGTVSTEDLEKLVSNYDAYHEVNFMDFRLKMDAKFLEPYLAVAAY